MIIFSDSKDIYYLRNYHPLKWQGEENDCFDYFSEKILELKNKEKTSIDFWFEELKKHLKMDESFAIAVVPSHSSGNQVSGIHLVAQKLAKSLPEKITDATLCLIRVKNIDRLSTGGNRELDIHFQSMKVINLELIQNKNVLLLDDVSTTGNSLRAGKELLLKAGASKVKCVALGKTVTYYDFDDSVYEKMGRDASGCFYAIDNWEIDEHEKICRDAEQSHFCICEEAEDLRKQIKDEVEYAGDAIDNWEIEEHEKICRDAEQSQFCICEEAEDLRKQIKDEVEYAGDQIQRGAHYSHLELCFIPIRG
ncbi:phosphoribosyltransferase [Microcoleus sp. D3_18_C4]|uniref:phosphoribosyltransferase n=1 Tax=Microcoleus sp. D3_18_C4 TaxID=3055335 RepID=UPI002FD0502A